MWHVRPSHLVGIPRDAIQPIGISDQEDAEEDKNTVNQREMSRNCLDPLHTRTFLAENACSIARCPRHEGAMIGFVTWTNVCGGSPCLLVCFLRHHEKVQGILFSIS